MEGMEEKLNNILNNPQLMQQIMSMANSLSPQSPVQQEMPAPPAQMPDFDPVMLQKVIQIAGQLGADPHQKALLNALQPYLANHRLQKLEKAIRAAKLANLVSEAFRSGALSFLAGR